VRIVPPISKEGWDSEIGFVKEITSGKLYSVIVKEV
jgi:hypothetical protein